MLLYCSAFVSLDHKSPVASSHLHSSIFLISSTKESRNHSSKVRLNPASMIFLDTSSCCMHLLAEQQLLCQYYHGQCDFLTCMCFREDKDCTCCWPWQMPSSLVGLDAQSFHVVQFFSDHSMSANEKWKTFIPLLVNNSVASSGVRGWQLNRSRAAMIFGLTTSLVALTTPFPVLQ